MLLPFHSIPSTVTIVTKSNKTVEAIGHFHDTTWAIPSRVVFFLCSFFMLSQHIPMTSTGWSFFHLRNSRMITRVGKHFAVVGVVLRLGLHDSEGSLWDQTRHVLLLLVLKDFAKLLFADSERKTNLLHKPIDLTFDHRGKEKLFSWVSREQAYFFFQANVTNHTG